MVSTMKEDGCTKVQLTNDKEVYGAGLAQAIVIAAKEQGLDVIANDGIDKNAANYRSLAQKAKAAGADCFAFSGVTQNNAVQLFKDFAAAIPNAKLYGPDGTCESGFINTKTGIPASVAERYKCTSPTLPASKLPPAGQQFFKDYAAKFGGRPPIRTRSMGTSRCNWRWTRSSAPRRARRPTSSRRCSRPRTAAARWGRTRSMPTATRR